MLDPGLKTGSIPPAMGTTVTLTLNRRAVNVDGTGKPKSAAIAPIIGVTTAGGAKSANSVLDLDPPSPINPTETSGILPRLIPVDARMRNGDNVDSCSVTPVEKASAAVWVQ